MGNEEDGKKRVSDKEKRKERDAESRRDERKKWRQRRNG